MFSWPKGKGSSSTRSSSATASRPCTASAKKTRFRTCGGECGLVQRNCCVRWASLEYSLENLFVRIEITEGRGRAEGVDSGNLASGRLVGPFES